MLLTYCKLKGTSGKMLVTYCNLGVTSSRNLVTSCLLISHTWLSENPINIALEWEQPDQYSLILSLLYLLDI